MRKRIIIGLLAIVVIGVGVFVLTRPKPGTVEWHKRQYLATLDRLLGRTTANHLRSHIVRIAKIPLPELSNRKQQALKEKIAVHRAALIQAGYLEERRFAVSNWPAQAIERGAQIIIGAASNQTVRFALVTADVTNTNVLVVTAVPTDLPMCQDVIERIESVRNRQPNPAVQGHQSLTSSPPK